MLIPAGEPLLREFSPLASALDRLEMCNLAINDLPIGIKEKVSTSDIEIKRHGPSYAIETVEALNNSNNELFWIIGSDAYANIEKWHRSTELQNLVSFIVIDRPGKDIESNVDGLDIGALNISATEIRNDNKFNGTSPSVRKFIIERKLYAR